MDIGSKINPLLTLNYMQAENENKYFSCKIKTLLRRMHEKITYDTGVLYGFSLNSNYGICSERRNEHLRIRSKGWKGRINEICDGFKCNKNYCSAGGGWV